MKKVFRWYLMWIVAGLLIGLLGLLSGCAEEEVGGVDDVQPVVPYRGPRAGWDTGAPDAHPGREVQQALDVGALLVIDAVPAVPETGAGVDFEVAAQSDTAPVCPVVAAVLPPNAGEFIRPSVTVQATSTDGFCFQICDTALWGMSWKGFSGRTVTVNETALILGSIDPISGLVLQPDTGGGEPGTLATPLPRPLDGRYTFRISAGSSASASLTLVSNGPVCP